VDAVLVVNLDNSPLSVASLKRAVRLLLSGKAKAVETSPKVVRSSGGFAMPMPTVVRMLYYVVRKPAEVKLTKANVLIRDGYACAYCGTHGTRESMTVDHVVPKSKGGLSSWKNLVGCCVPCNAKKANRTPAQAGMTLLVKPRRPLYIPFVVVKRTGVPNSWRPYLWSIGVEERPTA
jgi:5-methylcytosine-specific restriction endonuclease McrA